MKRIAGIVGLVAVGLLLAVTLACAVTPLGHGSNGRWFVAPCDYSFRLTEIKCLKMGVNPFDVWHGDIDLPPFYPNVATSKGPEYTEPINAYAPWEYALMYPLTLLPRGLGWAVYSLVMVGCLVFVLGAARRFLLVETHDRDTALALAADSVLVVAYPVWSNACIGNFATIVLAALVAMALALNRGHDVLAGFCWTIAMLKPQLAILFAIPLLMRRRLIPCFVAGTTCFVLSLVPAAMCSTSPFTLILQTPAANLFCFHGSGTWPYALCGHLFGGRFDVTMALMVGLALCVVLTRLLKDERDWLVYLMPTACCAAAWTYVNTYGHALSWFAVLVLLRELVRDPRSKALWALALAVLLFSTRFYNALNGLAPFVPHLFPPFFLEEPFRYHADSLNTLADLLICVGLVLRTANRSREKTK